MYEQYDRDGIVRAVIERSALIPYMWWWAAWSEILDANGQARGLRNAKSMIEFARMANAQARSMRTA